jgi:hypothetical protein
VAEVELTAAFSTLEPAEQEAIRRLLVETIEALGREPDGFRRARVVFTESDERCGLTAELDGVKREGVPLSLELEDLEAARGEPAARGRLADRLRAYFRRVAGR